MTEVQLQEMEENPDGVHSCPKCGKEVPNERAFAVKTMRCCACTPQGFKPRALYFSNEREGEGGCMVFLQDENSFNAARNAYNENVTLEIDDAEVLQQNANKAKKLEKEES